MARIDPVPRAEWPPLMDEALVALRPRVVRHPVPPPGGRAGRPRALNTMGTFAHHPDLALAFLGLNGHLLYGTTLTLRQRELLIMRLAVVRRSSFQWAQHHVHHDECDLAEADYRRIVAGPDAPGWEPLEAAMLRAVDELVGDGRIGAATWAALVERLDVRQVLDLIFTVGAYETIGWVTDSFDLELDADVPTPPFGVDGEPVAS